MIEAPFESWSKPAWVSSTDGVRLPVSRRTVRSRPELAEGDATRPTVVIAHATGFHGRVYDPVVPSFSGFEVVTADLRGHGDAETPAGLDYRWESFADDLLAVVRSLDPRTPSLFGFGHSMGAACLLMVEETAPGTFDALFCYEPVIHPPDLAGDAREGGGAPRNRWIERTRRRRDQFVSRADAYANYASKPPYEAFDPRALSAYVDHGFAVDDAGRLHLKCRPEVEATIYEMGPRHQTWKRLRAVECPVMIARGSTVTPGPSSWADAIAAEIPHGELYVFDGLGHLGPLEEPARVGVKAAAFFEAKLSRNASTPPE